MKTKIALSLMAIVMAAAMIVSGTMAYFTDHTTNTGTISSGTLNLDVKGANNYIDLASVSGLEPGGAPSGDIVINITNTGTMNLAWLGNLVLSGNNDLLDKLYVNSWKMEFLKPNGNAWLPADEWIVGGVDNPADGAGYPDLTAKFISSDTDNKVSLRKFADAAINNGMNFGPYAFGGSLKPNYSYRMTITVGLASSAANKVMGQSCYLSFVADATQINWKAMQQYISFFDSTAYTDWFVNNLANQH